MRPFAISIGIVLAIWTILIGIGAIAKVLLPVNPMGSSAPASATAHDYAEPTDERATTPSTKTKRDAKPKYKIESAGKYQDPNAAAEAGGQPTLPHPKVESAAKYGGGDPEAKQEATQAVDTP